MKTKSSFLLAVGLFIGVVLACNATTANISSLKVSTDEAGKNESKTFKPGDKVYAIAQISNNPSKVKAKFRVLYDAVDGEKAGEVVKGAENTLDIDGDRAATFWITLPEAGFKNGRYKVEISMLTESGEQKDQETSTFEVTGY
jgi:ABC-type Na+ efflux pump permease subunit